MSRYGITLSGKIDLKPSRNTNFTIGGQFNYSDGQNYANGSIGHSMYNYDKNILFLDQTWRVFGRFTQRFASDAESSSFIKNIYYSIQFDYSEQKTRTMDPNHKEDIFKYGYLGDYTTYKIPTYALVDEIEINNNVYQNVNLSDYYPMYQYDRRIYLPYTKT